MAIFNRGSLAATTWPPTKSTAAARSCCSELLVLLSDELAPLAVR